MCGCCPSPDRPDSILVNTLLVGKGLHACQLTSKTCSLHGCEPYDHLSTDIFLHNQVLAGGHVIEKATGGQFFAPTVLTDVRPEMRIWREEVFGPVMAIIRCEDDAEAIRLANDCAFGLGSAVFSRSRQRALSVGAQLQVRIKP